MKEEYMYLLITLFKYSLSNYIHINLNIYNSMGLLIKTYSILTLGNLYNF